MNYAHILELDKKGGYSGLPTDNARIQSYQRFCRG